MAHTFGTASTRTSSTSNPITTAGFTLAATDTVLALILKVNGGTNRTGGEPSINGVVFSQANSTQKAAASPEASCELWYLLNPYKLFPPGSYAVTIPNSGGLTVFYTLATGRAAAGGSSAFDGANGSNGTSTNPTPNSITTTTDGDIGFAVFCSGATDADPATPSGTGFGTGTGTPLGTFDDGQHGGGQQYHLQATPGAFTLGWTFGTSEDWGCVAAYFYEIPPLNLNNFHSVKVSGSDMFVTEHLR